MIYNLFLDDFRVPNDCSSYTGNKLYVDEDWIIVRNYNEFVKIIKEKGLPSKISFDHDLAPEHYTPEKYWNSYQKSKKWQESQKYVEKTGFDCAKWLIDYCMDNNIDDFPEFYIHSMNPVGADNIQNLIINYLMNK